MITTWELGWFCAVVGICCIGTLVVAALLTVHDGTRAEGRRGAGLLGAWLSRHL